MKTCVTCKSCRTSPTKDSQFWKCGRASGSIDPVTGMMDYVSSEIYCGVRRSNPHDDCGPDGNLWHEMGRESE